MTTCSRLSMLLVALAGCGGGSAAPTPIPDGGPVTYGEHRAVPIACGLSTHTLDSGVDACLTDSDCGASNVCSCDGATTGYAHANIGNVCVTSNCRVDADCGSGGYCIASVDPSSGPFYGIYGYFCRPPGDTCSTDADCVAPSNGYCAYDKTVGHFSCSFSRAAG